MVHSENPETLLGTQNLTFCEWNWGGPLFLPSGEELLPSFVFYLNNIPASTLHPRMHRSDAYSLALPMSQAGYPSVSFAPENLLSFS